MNDSFLEKRVYVAQNPVRNVCAKIKVDRLNRFLTETREVFTTQKPFPSEIPLTMKIPTSNSRNTFSYQITIYQISFKIYASFKPNKLAQVALD